MSDHYPPAQGDRGAARWLIGATDPDLAHLDEESAEADHAAAYGRSLPVHENGSEDEPVGNSYAADRAAAERS